MYAFRLELAALSTVTVMRKGGATTLAQEAMVWLTRLPIFNKEGRTGISGAALHCVVMRQSPLDLAVLAFDCAL